MNNESDLMGQKLSVLLDSLRATQASACDAARTVELDQARVGRLSRMDALQAQAMTVESSRRREVRICNIRAALARIERGEYGDCIECGEPVDPRRLQADPAAALCIACAEVSGSSG